MQSQLQAILAQLEHYKATNNYLQCERDKQELVKILQEQMNHTLEFQNQMLEKNNEGLRKCYQIRMRKYHIWKVIIKTYKTRSKSQKRMKSRHIEMITTSKKT